MEAAVLLIPAKLLSEHRGCHRGSFKRIEADCRRRFLVVGRRRFGYHRHGACLILWSCSMWHRKRCWLKLFSFPKSSRINNLRRTIRHVIFSRERSLLKSSRSCVGGRVITLSTHILLRRSDNVEHLFLTDDVADYCCDSCSIIPA